MRKIKLALAMLAAVSALCLAGCSATDKKVEAEGAKVAVKIADEECLARVPKGLEEVCDVAAGLLDGIIQKFLSDPAVAARLGAAPDLTKMSVSQKRVLLGQLLSASR